MRQETQARPPADAGTTGVAREALAAVVAHAPVCIAVVRGHELRYTLVNAAYQAILPGVAMLGRLYRDVFPEAAAAGAEERVRRVMESGEPWVIAGYRAPTAVNPGAVWEGQIIRLPLSPGEPPSALVTVQDVSAL